MAIQFARVAYVSRKTGGNACRKSAYNQREAMSCERTGELFYFKHKTDNVFHEVILPQGADAKFKDSKVLWNAAESLEKRKDSQVCKEAVIALPDDKQITLDDRIELTRRIADALFVAKGLAVQVDIHAPHDGDKNWHAHMLATTRRFTQDGKNLNSHKARDTDPVVRKGSVVEADLVGEIVRDIQNDYFAERGLDIRVDPIGLVAQEHLGPVRMRNHMNDALIRSELIKGANEKLSQDPEAIITELTRERATFIADDVNRFCAKHVPTDNVSTVVETVLASKQLIRLFDKENGQDSGNFTTKAVRDEENKLLRFADNLSSKATFAVSGAVKSQALERSSLTPEQRKTFEYVTNNDSNLKIIIGRAGVGKSFVTKPIREAYEDSGYKVVGLAPTNKVASDLAKDGFKEAMSCHSLLFKVKNGKNLSNKTVLMIDEAAMIGTPLFVELLNVAKKANCKLVLLGDDRQLPAIDRGGMFSVMANKHGSSAIETIQRQTISWQRAVAQDLSEFKFNKAARTMEEHGCIKWYDTKEESLKAIVDNWAKDSLTDKHSKRFVLAQRNVDVDALNGAIREVRKERGEIGNNDYEITTLRGQERFAVGDRVQFALTDKTQRITNGYFGNIKLATEDKFLIALDNGEKLQVDPTTYKGLRHGYAGTVYKAQGSTIAQTYILHDDVTNQNNSYVAMTRHSKNIQLFVSYDKTKDFDKLVTQMSRCGAKVASVNFTTREELAAEHKRQTAVKPVLIINDHLQKAWIGITDYFHQNAEFYDYKKAETVASAVTKIEDTYNIDYNSREAVQANIERRLYNQHVQQYNSTPDVDKKVFHQLQAARATQVLFENKQATEQNPTYEQVDKATLRSGYEIKRAIELKAETLEELSELREVRDVDHLKNQLFAERLAAIESRLAANDIKMDLSVPNQEATAEKALAELASNLERQKDIATKLSNDKAFSGADVKTLSSLVAQHYERTGQEPNFMQFKKYEELTRYLTDRKRTLETQYKDKDDYARERIVRFQTTMESDAVVSQKAYFYISRYQGMLKIQDKAHMQTKEALELATHEINISRREKAATKSANTKLVKEQKLPANKISATNLDTQAKSVVKTNQLKSTDYLKKATDPSLKAWKQVSKHLPANNTIEDISRALSPSSKSKAKLDVTFEVDKYTPKQLEASITARLSSDYIERYNKMPSTETKLFHQQQASKARNIILENHQTSNSNPTYERVDNSILRGGYEVKRAAELKRYYIDDLKYKQKITSVDYLKAQTVAERKAVIEGRIGADAITMDLKVNNLYALSKTATQELAANIEIQKSVAEQLSQNKEFKCADVNMMSELIVRHHERTGQAPNLEQFKKYEAITSYLSERRQDLETQHKRMNPDAREKTINFLIAKEAEGIIGKGASIDIDNNKDMIAIQKQAQVQTKDALKQADHQISISRDRGIER